MTLALNSTVGPYQILALLGAGGMGEVYRARDTRLGREVALKVLLEIFARDPERLARFQREAQLLASLNHPNIAALYGLEESGGVRALVMELVEGPTLGDRIRAGPLPVEEALPIARQIADALEYAHDRAVMHRDLKPANVKVKADGAVKVLDFGLAKALDDQPAPPASPGSPTLSLAATRAGVILGTAAYMSPEQAKGQPADRRSDIWAFGVVLYEMLTGQQLFGDATVPETLASVMMKDPPLDRLPGSVPGPIRNLVRRCLERDPRRRLQAIGEARLTLEDPWSGPPREEAALRPRRPFAWMAATAVAITAALILAGVHFRETPAREHSVRLEVSVPEQFIVQSFHLSPDGRYLAIAASEGGRYSLWVRPLDSLQTRAVPGAEDARSPFWSPDSRFIGFFAQEKLKKVAVEGGPPQTICDAPGTQVSSTLSGAWSPQGVIVFEWPNIGVLYQVPATGGVPQPLTKSGAPGSGSRLNYPAFLPGGRRFLYRAFGDKPETSGVFAGALDGTPPVRLLPDVSNAIYAPSGASRGTGHLLFRRDQALMAQPFDPRRLQLTGEAFPLVEQVGIIGLAGGYAYAAFTVSGNGALAYLAGGSGDRQLVWMERTGKRLGSIGKPGAIGWELLSPDEKTVAFTLGDLSNVQNIWLHELARGTTSRFTSGSGSSISPVWSPDGRRIVFASSPDTNYRSFDIYQKPASGAGKEELLLRGGRDLRVTDWSQDRISVGYMMDPKTSPDLWLLPLSGERKPFPYLQTESSERQGQFSPDGRFMAYTSDESGQNEVYVQPVPPTGARWPISTGGGSRPRWRRDGRELFYVSAGNRKLMAVPVMYGGTTSGSFQAGAAQALFGFTPNPSVAHQFGYQPRADGQRFLVNVPAGGEAPPPALIVVLNWQAR